MEKKRKKRVKNNSVSKPEITSPERLRRKLSPAKLPDKLRRIRLRYALTQEQMIVIINPEEDDGINRARVSQYERNLRIPSLIEVYNYARYAGIPVEILLSDDFDLPDEFKNY